MCLHKYTSSVHVSEPAEVLPADPSLIIGGYFRQTTTHRSIIAELVVYTTSVSQCAAVCSQDDTCDVFVFDSHTILNPEPRELYLCKLLDTSDSDADVAAEATSYEGA